MNNEVTLTVKEQQRVKVLNAVERGVLTGKQAAEVLGVSVRQVRRLVAAYRKEGVVALAHGNRGRRPAHTVPEAVSQQVVQLARERYPGCNDSHLTEVLAEREGISLSRSTVRRIVRAAGLPSPRRPRSPVHRVRRERYPQEGMLLQVDGSHHDWLEGRGPRLVLLGAIDDATGTVPGAVFWEREDHWGYLTLLQQITQTHGLPLALYADRHGVFWRSPREADTLDEQLAGRREPTQVGRMLEELGIGLVYARSPQAKGRIERLWGTLQDRLVAELRWAGATTPGEANAVLTAFLPRFNARFGVPPTQPGRAYRPWPADLAPEQVFCLKERRVVAKDNTVQWHGQRWQLFPTPQRASYAKAKVEVQERLDGSLAFVHQGVVLSAALAPSRPAMPAPAPSAPTPSPPRPGPGRPPAPDHPWRRWVTKSRNT